MFRSSKVLPDPGVVKALTQTARLDPFEHQIWSGLKVYSQSASSDIWLMLKNEHVVVSMFLAHPKHPYDRVTRARVTALSCILAYGLMCIFASTSPNETVNTILSLVLGITIQTVYDTTLKAAATCSCVQHGVPVCVRDGCMFLGKGFIIIQACVALVFFVVGLVLLIVISNTGGDADDYDPDFVTATVNWAISKLSSFFFTTLITSIVFIYLKRRQQLKPARDADDRQVFVLLV